MIHMLQIQTDKFNAPLDKNQYSHCICFGNANCTGGARLQFYWDIYKDIGKRHTHSVTTI